MQGFTTNHSTTLYGVLHALDDALTKIQVFTYFKDNHVNVPVDVLYDDAHQLIESLDDDLALIRNDLRCIVGESFTQASR